MPAASVILSAAKNPGISPVPPYLFVIPEGNLLLPLLFNQQLSTNN